jgi:hypothetical protein
VACLSLNRAVLIRFAKLACCQPKDLPEDGRKHVNLLFTGLQKQQAWQQHYAACNAITRLSSLTAFSHSIMLIVGLTIHG